MIYGIGSLEITWTANSTAVTIFIQHILSVQRKYRNLLLNDIFVLLFNFLAFQILCCSVFLFGNVIYLEWHSVSPRLGGFVRSLFCQIWAALASFTIIRIGHTNLSSQESKKALLRNCLPSTWEPHHPKAALCMQTAFTLRTTFCTETSQNYRNVIHTLARSTGK